MGWSANHRHEWHSHEWKLLANHPASDKKLVIHGNPYIILFPKCISSTKTQRNRWKLPPIDRSILVVYVGSVGCGIVTSCKYLLWRHFYRLSLSSKRLSGSHAPSRRCQADYHSLMIKSNSRLFHSLAYEKPSFYIVAIMAAPLFHAVDEHFQEKVISHEV